MIQMTAASVLGLVAGVLGALYQGTLRRVARRLVRAGRRARRRLLARTHKDLLQPHGGSHSAAWRKAYDPAAEDTRAFPVVAPADVPAVTS